MGHQSFTGFHTFGKPVGFLCTVIATQNFSSDTNAPSG